MVRPRRDEQDVLLDRIASALEARQELRRWTLADIAPAAGLSPAGLIKRFGSRRGLIQALSRRWIDAIPDGPLGRVPAEQELREWVAGRDGTDDPHAVASGLVHLIDDLMDPDLRLLLAEGWEKEIRYLAALIVQLDLPRVRDPDVAAAILFDALNGAMLRGAARSNRQTSSSAIDHLMEVWA